MDIYSIQWNDDDIAHIARHGIDPIEVEDICFEKHFANKGRYGRYVLYGQSHTGRYIKLILERLYDHVFRTITAYDMTESEKHNYKSKKSW
jgi:hypothetical protein